MSDESDRIDESKDLTIREINVFRLERRVDALEARVAALETILEDIEQQTGGEADVAEPRRGCSCWPGAENRNCPIHGTPPGTSDSTSTKPDKTSACGCTQNCDSHMCVGSDGPANERLHDTEQPEPSCTCGCNRWDAIESSLALIQDIGLFLASLNQEPAVVRDSGLSSGAHTASKTTPTDTQRQPMVDSQKSEPAEKCESSLVDGVITAWSEAWHVELVKHDDRDAAHHVAAHAAILAVADWLETQKGSHRIAAGRLRSEVE